MNSNRRDFILQAAALGAYAALPAFGRADAHPNHPGQIRDLPKLTDIRLGGELGTRYQAATYNILTRQDRYSLESFRSSALCNPGALWWDWPGDQIGRWLSVVHVASAFGWTPASVNRTAVLDQILPLQRPQGSFSTESPDVKDVKVISGNAFAMRGLMDAYEDTGEERVLGAGRRLAGFFAANFDYYKDRGPQGSMHEFYGHCVDGLVRLYVLSGDQDALALAERIAARAGLTQHTHHSLSMYRGVLDLYNVTGNADCLKRAEAYLAWVRANRIVTGGVPEGMPKSEQDEGCALADYVVVNLMMFGATGQDSYLEEAENTLVNHFFMNQFHTGGFGHRLYEAEIVGGKGWQGWEGKFGSENPGCCSLWGPRALGLVGQYIVTCHDGAVEVNLYPTAEVSFTDPDLTLRMESDFPRMRQAALTIYAAPRAPLELRLRVAGWAEGVTVEVNGVPAAVRPTAGRVLLRRAWRAGDHVRLQFASSLRLVRWPQADSPRAGIFDGPLCLGLSNVDADVDARLKVVAAAGGKLALGSDGQPQLVGAKGPVAAKLRPLADDWQSPDVFNPHRLRVLFEVATK